MIRCITAALSMVLAVPAFADAPVIKNVKAKKTGTTWTFDVTVEHGDTGWEDYANAWRLVDANGQELGMRTLVHPHVDEQPFTRSLSGVSLPADLTEVGVQVSDTIGGWSSAVKKVPLR